MATQQVVDHGAAAGVIQIDLSKQSRALVEQREQSAVEVSQLVAEGRLHDGEELGSCRRSQAGHEITDE